jgi:ATP-dependent helicase/nuclease subunit A
LQRLQRAEDLAPALHATRQLPAVRYTDAQWQVLSDLLVILRIAIAELELAMRERGEADYTANAIAARRALGTPTEPTDLALRLDYRLRHVLVDEFQDTSRGQVALLALLSAGWVDGDGRTLFCVGDPMQSIYRFRHADVGLFLNLKRHGLNQLRLAPLRLTVNFRATQPVLAWVNQAFEQALPRIDDPERGAVSFTRSEARAESGTDGGVFVHPIAFDKTVTDRAAARQAEAVQVAELIAKSLTARPAASIAVLVSNRRHLLYVVRELRSRAIAFQAADIDPLVERPAIQDLVALTRALVHLADRSAWLAVLRAPWCGLGLADLHALCADIPAARATIWQLLRDGVSIERLSAQGRQSIERCLPALQRGVELRGRIALRDCVERTWHALGAPATLAISAALEDCSAFFDRLEALERQGDLPDVTQLEEGLLDLYAAPEAGDARVELMTIHRAKGLEFDIVILPGLDSGARPDDPPLLRAHELPELHGKPALLLAPIAARGAEQASIYQWLDGLEKERARLERGRLLYVAATRAQRELHLFGAVESQPGQPGQPRGHNFLQLLWPTLESQFANCVASTEPRAQPDADTATVTTKRLPADWCAPAPRPPIGTAALRDVVENEPLPALQFEWVSETGRHVGTLVHREIERWARSGSASGAEQFASHRAEYLAQLAELGVPPALRTGAVERVVDTLTQMSLDQRGRWLLARHTDAASELALTGIVGGDVVNAVIDRTFVADGYRWIVDFKTGSHEGGGRGEFLDSETTRYRPQLQRYAQLMRDYRPELPVKAALYFPAMRAWREVELL